MDADFENFQIGVSYSAMSSVQKSPKKHKIGHEISKYLYLHLKFRTGKVFGTRKLILDSDFENFQVGMSYNAMSSWEIGKGDREGEGVVRKIGWLL